MLAQLPPALQKLQLPLRLRLWDGHEFNFGPTPSVKIVVKDPTLVAQFTHPSLDLLGSAFVEGRLELELAVDEHPDEQRVEDGDDRSLGRGEET